ncbi:MAG: FKBP-type peptidyl-prolyl cis-trans isomerase [Bacteroidales bacterium]|nr:FKBP-type peptidyl-prolyl cis-trans isomerase [Bacteroidales bacterium]
MKIKIVLFPILFVSLLLTTSCLTQTDSLSQYADWKATNDLYFTKMQDSTSYTAFNIPENRGGGMFYYKINTVGDVNGGSPLYTDTVLVHYKGHLVDGTLFDKTFSGANPDWSKNEDPRSFKVNQVVTGWTEALMQMKVGETRTIVLPYTLGYGTTGSSTGTILPYSTLIFEVRLLAFGTPKK